MYMANLQVVRGEMVYGGNTIPTDCKTIGTPTNVKELVLEFPKKNSRLKAKILTLAVA